MPWAWLTAPVTVFATPIYAWLLLLIANGRSVFVGIGFMLEIGIEPGPRAISVYPF